MLRVLGPVALAYVAARLLLVLAMGDVFVYGEENEKAFVAECLRAGVDVPYGRLAYHPYEGGGFVASHLKAALIPWLGATPLMHKAAAILWGLLTLWATVALARAHGRDEGAGPAAGLGAAFLAGLALVLAPESLAKGSLLHLGIHVEALLFIAVTLHLGLVAMGTPEGERVPPRALVGLGLAAGFGTYFSYQVPLAVLTVLLGLAITRWRTIFAPPLVVATLVGLVPWFAMAALVGGEVLDLHGERVGGEGGLLAGIRGLFGSVRAAAGEGLVGAALVVGFVGTAAGLAHRLPTGRRMRALLVVGGFVDLWSLAAAWTGLASGAAGADHWFPYLRFAPAVWGLLVVLALAAGPALEAVGADRGTASARVARASAAIVLGVGGVALARMVDEGDLSRARANLARLDGVRAVDARGALQKLLPRLMPADDGRPAEVRAALAAAPFAAVVEAAEPAAWREVVAADLVGIAASLVEAPAGAPADVDALRSAFRELLPPSVSDAAIERGLGPLHFRRIVLDEGGVDAALDRDGLRPAVADAVGRYGGWFGVRPGAALAQELRWAAGAPLGEAYLAGVGERAFRSGVMQPYWGAEFVHRPAAVREALLRAAADSDLSPSERAALAAGFDACAAAFGFEPPLSSAP